MSIVERVRGRAGREVVLGPLALTDGVLTMRTPRLRDGVAWSAARVANRQWLERAFPAWGGDWVAEQSAAAWVERWWRLRREIRRGARPFVLLLDGRLVGELGIDAIDAVSNSGEASVWMVRDHGSAAVMNGASLLLIQHAFGGAEPLDRLISPVATTSRKGRTPGLTAVGFRIEATVARPVGRDEPVDHDIWVLNNTARVRHKADQALAAMTGSAVARERAPAASAPVPSAATGPTMAVAAARAAVRSVRRAAGSRSSRRALPAQLGPITVQGATVEVRPTSAGRWDVLRGGRPVGRVVTGSDPGTAAATVQLALDGPDRDVLSGALRLVLDAAPAWAAVARTVEVRVPTDPSAVVGTAPDHDVLTALGLRLVATYTGNPEGRAGWPGEQRWRYDVPAGVR